MRVVNANPCATDRDDFRMRLNENQFDHKQTRLPTEVAVRLDERASSGSVPNPSEALAGKHQVYADEPHNLDSPNYDHLQYVTNFMIGAKFMHQEHLHLCRVWLTTTNWSPSDISAS